VAFNAPHTPLQVPERYYEKYRQAHLEARQFPSAGHPIPGSFDADTTAKVYGMVENIDDNVGRLLASLDRLDLASETIVIFLTDNGPQQPRYNAGMFEQKGTTYEGGIRVPFYVRWPGHYPPGREVDRVAAHVDVTPTLLDVCDVRRPEGVTLDGRSLRPLLEASGAPWPDRTLYFQWHRGDVPQRFRAFAARNQRYKLVQPAGAGDAKGGWAPSFKLYDMSADPLEERDVASARPEVIASMKAEYEAWFDAVTRGLPRPRIVVGAPEENPVRLTRQDWRGPRAGWTPTSLGHWDVDVVRAGEYRVTVRLAPADRAGTVTLSLAGSKEQKRVQAGAASVVFENATLSSGEGMLQAEWGDGGAPVGALDVVLEHIR
jgi:arylsulfatase A-like enzyme